MTSKEALAILEPIPHEEWTTREYTDRLGRHCAIGHLATHFKVDPLSFSWGGVLDSLRAAVGTFGRVRKGWYTYTLSGVNDEPYFNGYTEDNPKDRVIHLLKDMVEAGY